MICRWSFWNSCRIALSVTQLQHFLVECGRTTHTHTNLQSVQEDFKAQCTHKYNENIIMEHALMPWVIRHSAYFNKWGREQHTPLCEFGETVQHMLPTVKEATQVEPTFYMESGLARVQSPWGCQSQDIYIYILPTSNRRSTEPS